MALRLSTSRALSSALRTAGASSPRSTAVRTFTASSTNLTAGRENYGNVQSPISSSKEQKEPVESDVSDMPNLRVRCLAGGRITAS